MAESISVGAVSLDLVIKDTLDKQLAGIKSRVENMFGKATEQASSRAQAAIDNVAGSAESATKKVKDIAKGFDVGKVEKNISKMTAALDSASDSLRRMSNYLYSYLESFYRFFATWNGAKNIEPLDPISPQAVENTENVAKETEEVVDNTEEASKSTEKLTQKTSKLSSVASKAGKVFKTALNVGFKAPLYAGGKALDALRSKFKGVAASVNETTKPVSRLMNTLKSSARRIFLIAGIAAVFKGLSAALGEAANSNEEFSKSLESIKFNLAVAFEPILTAVMPMLNTLMSGIAAVTEKIAAFTSALFGKTYQQSAQAVAKSKQAASAAKQAGKEAKEASRYLADFDEMRVHQESSDNSSGGDSGDSTDYSQYVNKDVQLPDWAAKLKDSITSGDWAGVGKLLAEKINGVFGRINWEKVKNKVTTGAKKAAEGINGFVDNLKWKNIGNSIGEGITTAFSAAYTFLKTTKWKSIGSGFASFLNGVMEKTDFSLVGATLGAKLNAIVGLALGFVETFNFAEAGEGLAEIINGWVNEVNWDDVGSMIGGALEGAIEFAFGFVENFDAKKAASSISTAFNKAVDKLDTKKLGKTVSDAFVKVWDFIATALKEIDWEDVGKKIGDFISGINWGEILKSIFKVIGEALKAAPKLLLGLVESLDFEGAAGLFGVLFAPKMAKSLLSMFKSDAGVTSTLGQSASTLATKIASGADLSSYSFTQKFAAATTAFFAGWKLGSYLYDTFQEQFDWWGEKLGAVFCRSLNKEVEAAEARLNKYINNDVQKTVDKWKAKGVNLTKDDIVNDTWRAKVKAAGYDPSTGQKIVTASTYTPTVSERLQLQKLNDEIKRLKAIYPSMPSSALESMARGNLGIPKLAAGGIVKAPTLALVGDNTDARTNPEVVAPLSELQQLLGGGGDVAKYLQQIIALLETMQLVFKTEIDGKELFRTIVSQNKSYKARTGASAF